MGNRLIITASAMPAVTGTETNYTVTALVDDHSRMLEVSCDSKESQPLLDSIHIGRVKDIVPNLNAAFIELEPGFVCFYSMAELKRPIFTKKNGKKPLCVGDELVVQVIKEGIKTKFPVVTTDINFSGRYAALTTGNTRIGVSSKLRKDQKAYYQKLLSTYQNEEYGYVIRTAVADVADEALIAELEQLKAEYEDMKQTAIHKTCFTCLKKAQPGYLKTIARLYTQSIEEIVTDSRDIYQEVLKNLSMIPALMSEQVRLYEDAGFPLTKMYSIEEQLKHAVHERVWLKSGAYLIIQPTEALTVVDVNSGKNVAKKNPQENFLKINREAATEIALQLRLRNISGIVVIDFINLDSKEATDELMHVLRMELKKDAVPTSLIDITRLGLVEVTRKKERRSLREQLGIR